MPVARATPWLSAMKLRSERATPSKRGLSRSVSLSLSSARRNMLGSEGEGGCLVCWPENFETSLKCAPSILTTGGGPMKAWRLMIVMVAAVALAGLIAGCSGKLPTVRTEEQPASATEKIITDRGSGVDAQPMSRINLDNVVSVSITGFIGFPPRSEQPPKTLQMTDQNDRTKITKIVRWINAAKVTNENAPLQKPVRQSVLVITLNDGQSLNFRRAVDCTVEQRTDGMAERCTGVRDQVVLEAGSNQPRVRLLAPELAQWLNGRWDSDLPRQSK